jgi:hypothetical protein
VKRTPINFRQLVAGFFGAAFLIVPTDSLAKAYFATEEEMIQRSEMIAIVDISSVEDTQTKRDHWTYRRKANGTVHQALKGSLPREVSLYGDEDFVCAQVKFQPGRFLVFLSHDGDLLVGSNWHLSVRPLKGTQIEWYVPGERLKLAWQPLDVVLERIKRSLHHTPDQNI